MASQDGGGTFVKLGKAVLVTDAASRPSWTPSTRRTAMPASASPPWPTPRRT
ncbi:hypothetical protein [Teichococcus aestuarii]|uniref:hypothetical protein n=1 Tax=Teichococcus aestuarii TaxID=568898 RepID=UPI00361E70C0